MRDIEPKIFRQRAVIEAKIGIEVTKEAVEKYLKGLTDHLQLRIYGGPIVYSTGSAGKEINQGFDGFCALVESGISISVWSNAKLIAVLVHTCKNFEVEKAVEFTKKFFKATDIVWKEF